MTVMNRLVKYLSVITKVNMDCRPRIQNTETGQFFPIAITADLKQTLELMKVAASGVRPYLVNFYNKVIPPLIEEMDGKPNTVFVLDDNGKPAIGSNGKPIVFERESRVGVRANSTENKRGLWLQAKQQRITSKISISSSKCRSLKLRKECHKHEWI
jgi:hypothetical protein